MPSTIHASSDAQKASPLSNWLSEHFGCDSRVVSITSNPHPDSNPEGSSIQFSNGISVFVRPVTSTSLLSTSKREMQQMGVLDKSGPFYHMIPTEVERGEVIHPLVFQGKFRDSQCVKTCPNLTVLKHQLNRIAELNHRMASRNLRPMPIYDHLSLG